MGAPKPCANTVFLYSSPCILRFTYACTHRKSQGLTCRKCDMVMGGLPNPAKTRCFPTLAPAPYILIHFGKRVRAWQNIAKRRDQQVKLSQSLQEFPRISKKNQPFETSRAKHIISYHGFHIVLQSSTLSMSSRLHKRI